MTSAPLGESFVHLHVHSEYSLLDGACRVDGLCRRSADGGAPGVALTDHGVMFGAMEFYYAAKEHSLVPIVGCEAYIAPRGRFDKTVRDEAHVTLLAADLVGYRNLVALISKGFLEGYYYKPRIDMELLAKHHDGLIVLSGCMSSLVAQPFLRNEPDVARKAAREFADIFGDRFYIEIMRHGIPEQDVVNDGLIALARDMNLPLVATNDSHYLDRGDARAHDVLLCIQTGKTVADTSRMKFMTDEFYVKSAAEMRALFADVPDACDNTLAIAKRIDIRIPEKTFNIPHFPVPPRAERAHLPHAVRVATERLEAAREERTIDVWVAAPEDVAGADPGVEARAFVGPGEIVSAEVAAEPSLFDVGPVHGVGFDSALAKRLALAPASLGEGPPPAEHVGEAGAAEDGRPDGDGRPGDPEDAAISVVLEPAPPDEDETPDAYLREVCAAGLLQRYGEARVASDAALRERLEYELGVILKMGFASYFLIVWDFIKFARDRGIPVGPGRGSAVGSLVSYALRITDMDPIKFDLIFERFLNPDRISMPDIDTDFCVERRDEVIAYVTQKYGQDRVAQIVTFGTMAARGAINDAGRALAVPLADVQRIAKLIPSGPQGLSIDKALVQIADLRAQYDALPWVRELVDTARSIEGLARNASTHAAGVVISKDPLVDWAPLVKLGDDDVNTQYDMNWVERIGLLKMDFLGLRNLTVMKNAVDEIRRTGDPAFDLDTIPDDDRRAFEMLGRGDTTGVFQLESDGMRRVVTELKPSTLDDIVALVALYRPGPMDWIPQYISNKHGRTVPKYLHPKLVPILSTTHGVACLRGGTPVWYVSGMQRPIEDVRPGDEILSYHGPGDLRPGRVARVWPSGPKKLLRITLSTGTVIECSEDHRFPTPTGDVEARHLRPNRDGYKNGHYQYRAADTILLEAWPRVENDAAPRIGGERRAYLLGLLLGDGSLKAATKSVCCGDEGDAHIIAALFRREFDCSTSIRFHTRAWYVSPQFFSAPRPSPLTEWLDRVYGDRSWHTTTKEKAIPRAVLSFSTEERIGLVRGLWDSDGSYIGPAPYFRSSSPALIAGVALLLGSLRIGFYARENSVHVVDTGRFATLIGRPWLPLKRSSMSDGRAMAVRLSRLHELAGPLLRASYGSSARALAAMDAVGSVRIPPGHRVRRIRHFHAIHSLAYRELHLGDTRPVPIDTIEAVGEGECYDVQMEDQRNPYFVANGFVTHNCYQEQIMQIARDVAGFSMSQADELRKVMGKKQKEKIPAYREKFVNGAVATSGITESLAGEIFAFVEPFAGYGFNKCAHGSTEIQLPDGTRTTLSAAYRSQPDRIMSMWPDGKVRPHDVARIVRTGRKSLLEVRTASGKSIKITPDHRLLTTNGYREARDMRIGTELVVAPRRTTELQRTVRRAATVARNRSPEHRTRVSTRVAAYQAARDPEAKRRHMQQTHELHPELTRNGVAAMQERLKWLFANDLVWEAGMIAKSIASTRACYDTGPGYGRCSIASNGMWCASAPERDMCEWLIERGVTFEMHRVLGNGRICDYYFDGVYWEMDGMDRDATYFAAKYGDLPYVVVTPEDFQTRVAAHLGVDHATNGDAIVSIEPCGEAMTYDVEMAPNGPLNYIANRIVSHNSHAVAYGWIAYQTAFLKANHPRAYLAALMTSVKDKTDKLVEYLEEAKKVGIAVLPPDVNASLFDFTVVGEEIRFGLAAIKGVGENAVRSIIETRATGGPFADVFDVVGRVDLRAVNRKVFEALVKCGALDTLPGNRAQKLDALDLAIERASRAARDRESGQFSLFGETAHAPETRPMLRNLPAPPVLEQLAWEKETLGIFVSGHPLADVQEALVRGGATPVRDLRETPDDAFVAVAGMLIDVRRTITKAQQQMLVAKLEDMTGIVECIVFPKSYPQLQAAFVQDAIVTVRGRLSRRERRGATAGDDAPLEVSVHANEVAPFVRSAPAARTGAWHVSASSRAEIDALARLMSESPGKVPVVIHTGRQAARMPRGISESVYVRSELEAIFGRSGVWEGPP